MNYRRLFVIAVVLNLALAFAAYWFWQSSRGTETIRKYSHRASMEGFTPSASESAPPILAPVEVVPGAHAEHWRTHRAGRIQDD